MTRFQNRVAASRMLLPFIVVYAIAIVAISLHGMMPDLEIAIAIACFAVSTTMMVALNNSNALIRVYSRMVSAAFVAFTLTMPSWIDSTKMLPMQCCFAVFLYMIMSVYHDSTQKGRLFYCFMFIGVASIICPPSLLLLPVWLLCLFTCIVAPSLRQIIAALLGIVYPWLIYFVWVFLTGNIDSFVARAQEVLTLQPVFSYENLDIIAIAPVLLFNLVVIISSLHFFLNAYTDKLRTRQIFEFLIMMHFFLLLAMVLQPNYIFELFAFQLCVGSPVAGHFIALSSSKLSNLTFIVITLSTLAITAYNLWMLY